MIFCRLLFSTLLPGVLLFILAGCSFNLGGGGTLEETRFYLLESTVETEEFLSAVTMERNLVIGIGPVVFPSYLSRPQMVIRVSESQVRLAEFDHWAEPLEENFTRILIKNMTALYPAMRWIPFLRSGEEDVDYRVAGEVLRFDGNPGGKVVLLINWKIFSPDGTILVQHLSQFEETVEGEEIKDLVMVMSRAAASFCKEMGKILPVALSF